LGFDWGLAQLDKFPRLRGKVEKASERIRLKGIGNSTKGLG